jgi:hypothetical protein
VSLVQSTSAKLPPYPLHEAFNEGTSAEGASDASHGKKRRRGGQRHKKQAAKVDGRSLYQAPLTDADVGHSGITVAQPLLTGLTYGREYTSNLIGF